MGLLNRLFGKKPPSQGTDHVRQILREMLAASSFAALKLVFDRYPETLSDEFSDLLKRWIAAQTDPRAVEALSKFQELARLCRQHGVEAAFGGLVQIYPMSGYEMEVPALLDQPAEHLADLADQARQDPSLNRQRIELIDDLLNRLPAGRFAAFRSTLLNERGIAYQALPGQDRRTNQQKAIESYEEALRHNDPEKAPSQYAMIQSNLGTAYVNLVGGNPATNLERALAHYQEALRIYTPQAAPLDYARTQLNLSTVYGQLPTGERSANLRQAIACCREALTYLNLENAPLEFAKTQCYLAYAYLNLPAGDRSENLQQALDCIRQAQPILTPESAPYDHALTQVLLGAIYTELPSGDRTAHLDRAFQHFQAALAFFAVENYPFEYANAQNYLGSAHMQRTTGDRIENLHQAIVCFRNALTVFTPEVSPWGYAGAQSNLGACLAELPSADRSASLRQAIDCFQAALAVFTPESDPFQYATVQNHLGNVHYKLLAGNRGANLQQAIDCYQEALRFHTLETYPWEYATTQVNLGIAYRNLPAGDRAANLHQAIACYQAALAVYTPEAAPSRYAGVQNNLGIVYQSLPTGERETNLEKAIAAYRQALHIRTPEAAPDEYAETMHNLGNAYSRITSGDRLQSLQQAIACYQEALRFWTQATHPTDYAGLQVNLGDAYAALPAGVDPDSLEKAIACIREAMKVYSAETAPLLYASAVDHLGYVYSRMAGADREANLQQAIGLYEEALRYSPLEVVPADHRSTAHRLGALHFEAEAWEAAHAALDAAIAAGEMLYQAAATGISRQLELEAGAGLFAKDAFCLARLRRYTEAVERLEAGRVRSLADALTRHQAALHEANPADQDAFRQARELLEALEAEARGLSTSGPDLVPVRSFLEISNDMAEARQALVRVVQRIRAYRPDFMPAGLDFRDIAETVSPDVPLVYLVATARGSLALVVPPAVDALDDRHVLWLNDFRDEDLNHLLVQEDDRGRVTGGYLVGQVGDDPAGLQAVLSQALSILWERIARPLEDRLVGLGFHRAVLVTGGLLALLPLHATFEKITIAYIPSARLLLTAHQAAAARSNLPPVLLGIGNPLPNPRPLAFAQTEVDAIALLFPASGRRLLYEQQATQARLQHDLPSATYLHFACHGAFDVDEPLHSAIALSGDDQLTLRDLLDGDLDPSGSRLAVLSACQTGITDFSRVPDEAVGLPAGFLQAGVPGVVGTLWPVNDLSTALLMIKFYENHLKGDASTGVGPVQPAVALRQAQLWLRDVTNTELSELFEKYRMTAPDRPERSRMAFELASEKFREHTLSEPNERPFAHPYYWAPFVFYGV